MRMTQTPILVYLGRGLRTTSTAKSCAPRLRAEPLMISVTTAKTIASAAKGGKKYYYIISTHLTKKTHH